MTRSGPAEPAPALVLQGKPRAQKSFLSCLGRDEWIDKSRAQPPDREATQPKANHSVAQHTKQSQIRAKCGEVADHTPWHPQPRISAPRRFRGGAGYEYRAKIGLRPSANAQIARGAITQ